MRNDIFSVAEGESSDVLPNLDFFDLTCSLLAKFCQKRIKKGQHLYWARETGSFIQFLMNSTENFPEANILANECLDMINRIDSSNTTSVKKAVRQKTEELKNLMRNDGLFKLKKVG